MNPENVIVTETTNEVKPVVKPTEETHQLELNALIAAHGVEKGVEIFQQRVNRTEQMVELSYTLKSFYHEGAYALYKAVKHVIGDFDMGATKQMSGDKNPELLSVTLPSGEIIKIPVGTIVLPTFDKDSYLEIDYDYESVELTVIAVIKKKNESQVDAIIEFAKTELKERSIYKGAAISMEFDEDDQANEPEFLDLSNIDEKRILINEEAANALIPILSRIKNTDACIENGLDLKFGALMEGQYGTGKTLVAFLIAKIAIENDWTFVYLKDCNHIAKTLKIVENYTKGNKGIVLFTEDIDQAVRGERGKKIQDIVNTLDGGDTKALPIISIFTTNHIELIEPTFLRGKRIGSLISLGALDYKTAERFINTLVIDKNGDSLMDGSDITEAAKALCGIVPAFASEVIDKAKAYMINRGSKKISPQDIVISAESYKAQMEFAKLKVVNTEATDMEKVVSALGEQMLKGVVFYHNGTPLLTTAKKPK